MKIFLENAKVLIEQNRKFYEINTNEDVNPGDLQVTFMMRGGELIYDVLFGRHIDNENTNQADSAPEDVYDFELTSDIVSLLEINTLEKNSDSNYRKFFKVSPISSL